MRQAVVVFILICIISAIVVKGKNEDKNFLAKCTCGEHRNSASCNFASLTKKKLLKLVDKLMDFEIFCVQAEGYFMPTFSRKLISSANLQDNNVMTIENLPSPTNTPATPKSSTTKPAPPKASPSTKSKSKQTPSKLAEINKEASQVATTSLNPQMNCILDGMSCATKDHLYFLFPTPVIVHEIVGDPLFKRHNNALKEKLLDLEEEDDGCKFNLHGGYRSKDGFLLEKDESIQWLRNHIIPRMNYLLSLANSSHVTYELDGWGQVLRGGDGHSIHVHPGSMYAGVYYIAAPKEIDAKGRGEGCLDFVDPRNGAVMAQVVRGKTIYGEAIRVCPSEEGGTLVIFPSWLPHEVRALPSSTSSARIAVSFNIIYKP